MVHLKPESEHSHLYLENNDIIDYEHPAVHEKALQLQGEDSISTLKNIYTYMRDSIRHSVDIAEKTVISITASQVLQNGHGLCMAKAHLFAALCRANAIPAGFCYQTLIQPSLRFVHGLNAVYYEDTGEWYRIDIVGHRDHAPVEYQPHRELLFYTPTRKLSITEHPGIYAHPHPAMLRYLRAYPDLATALEHLPEEL